MAPSRRLGRALWLLLLPLGFWLIFRPDPIPADGRVHIRYWEKWTGYEEQGMRRMVRAFNESQGRIHVDYLSVSQIDQKLLLATAGGNPPDVAGIWDYSVVVYAEHRAIQPLDRYVRQAGLGREHYLDAFWNLCRHQGKTYALPTTPASVALHWNRKMFREAGLDPDRPPRTLAELDRMAAQLTQRDAKGKLTRMGFLPVEPGWWGWGWGYFFGGRLWDGERRATAVAKENVQALDWVKSYRDRYGARDLQVFQGGFGNFSSPQNAFMSGQVAMVLQGVWMAAYIHNANPNLDWDAAPFPYPADRPDLACSNPVQSDVLVIPTGAKHPREAWEFIRFLQAQERMEMLCDLHWKISPLRQVSERFLRRHKNKRIRLFQDLARERNAFYPPRVGIWREWQDEIKTALERSWIGGEPSETVLAYVDRRIQPKLNRYLDQLDRSVSEK